MSRSIHTTRRTLKDLRQQDFSSSKMRIKKIRKARQDLRRKRQIKSLILAERRKPTEPGRPVNATEIPIEILDVHEHIHFPATVADIRAILQRLPSSATDGLSSIRLGLVKEEMREYARRGKYTRDPWLGRMSSEYLPGIYGGATWGTYNPVNGDITLHAFVYDAKALPMPRPICELYLRLQMLSTLVHEVAHHHDCTQRIARGRWMSDRKGNDENYAEKTEYRWAHEIVLPYLAETYPREVRALCLWVARKGGWKPPFNFFVEDERKTDRNGYGSWSYSSVDAFESWLCQLPSCTTPLAVRTAFAWELRNCDRSSKGLVILDRLLKQHPTDCTALVHRARILSEEGRNKEAFETASRAVELYPEDAETLSIYVSTLFTQKMWAELLVCCERAEQVPKALSRQRLAHCRATAYCALGNEAAMNAALAEYISTLRAVLPHRVAGQEAYYRKWLRIEAGLEEATPVSTSATNSP